MTLVHVPRPPQSAMNPQRPVSALLKAQLQYLQDAELRLPAKYQSDIYINAIKTEGEASEYIRLVTEAIHEAHADAEAKRKRPPVTRKPGIQLAAVADKRQVRKSAGKPKKKSKAKRGRK